MTPTPAGPDTAQGSAPGGRFASVEEEVLLRGFALAVLEAVTEQTLLLPPHLWPAARRLAIGSLLFGAETASPGTAAAVFEDVLAHLARTASTPEASQPCP